MATSHHLHWQAGLPLLHGGNVIRGIHGRVRFIQEHTVKAVLSVSQQNRIIPALFEQNQAEIKRWLFQSDAYFEQNPGGRKIWLLWVRFPTLTTL